MPSHECNLHPKNLTIKNKKNFSIEMIILKRDQHKHNKTHNTKRIKKIFGTGNTPVV